MSQGEHEGLDLGPVKSISVCLPVLNGEAFLGRVLEGLVQQQCSIPWEFLVADCGSTDSTLELIADAAKRMPGPVRVHGIHRTEFNHADTRNLLIALSDADLCVVITDDAIPVGTDWLETIAKVFDDPNVWAAYLRNTPRPEADVLARSLSEHDEGYAAGSKLVRFPDYGTFEELGGDERRSLFNYNDTASALRRSVWQRFPYPRCDFGEDVLFARGILEGGGAIQYTDRAVIHHSHEYGPEVLEARFSEDSAFNAMWLQRVLVAKDKDMEPMVERLLDADEEFLKDEGYAGEELKIELERARLLREAIIRGSRKGSKETRRFTLGALLEGPRPAIRWRSAAGGLGAFEGLKETLDALSAAGWDVAEGSAAEAPSQPWLPAVQILAGVDDSMREAFEEAANRDRPTLVLVTQEQAEAFGMKKAVHSAWELALPERVPSPPFGDLWSKVVTGQPLELYTWRSEEQVDELRGAGRGVVEDASAERLRVLPVRLRMIAARSLRARPHIRYDQPGTMASKLEDGARFLDPVRILIPEGGAAEWDITDAGSGHRILLLQVEGLDTEKDVLLGGRLVLNGQVIAGVGCFRIASDTEWRTYRIPMMLEPGQNTLRIEGFMPEGSPTTLRVLRVALLDLAAPRRNHSAFENTFDQRGHDSTLDAVPRGGEWQDVDAVLLGPKAGSATFAIDGHLPGDYDCRLALNFTPDETTVLMHGRLLVDGVATARIGPVSCPPGGGNVELRFSVRLPGGRAELRFENRKRPFGPLGFLRIRRLVVTPKKDGVAPVPTKLQQFLQLPPRIGV